MKRPTYVLVRSRDGKAVFADLYGSLASADEAAESYRVHDGLDAVVMGTTGDGRFTPALADLDRERRGDPDGPMLGRHPGDDLAELVHREMCSGVPYRDRCRRAAAAVADAVTGAETGRAE